ncbi:hypothetical protein FI667_g17209, partial [Globisporangium splendens]
MEQEAMVDTGDVITTTVIERPALALYKPDRGDRQDAMSLQSVFEAVLRQVQVLLADLEHLHDQQCQAQQRMLQLQEQADQHAQLQLLSEAKLQQALMDAQTKLQGDARALVQAQTRVHAEENYPKLAESLQAMLVEVCARAHVQTEAAAEQHLKEFTAVTLEKLEVGFKDVLSDACDEMSAVTHQRVEDYVNQAQESIKKHLDQAIITTNARAQALVVTTSELSNAQNVEKLLHTLTDQIKENLADTRSLALEKAESTARVCVVERAVESERRQEELIRSSVSEIVSSPLVRAQQTMQRHLEDAIADTNSKSLDLIQASSSLSNNQLCAMNEQVGTQLSEIRRLALAKAESTAQLCASQQAIEAERKMEEVFQDKIAPFVATEERKMQQKLDQAIVEVGTKFQDVKSDSLIRIDSQHRALQDGVEKQLQELRSLAMESERKINELLETRLAELKLILNSKSAEATIKSDTDIVASTKVGHEAAKLGPTEIVSQSTTGNQVASKGSVEVLLSSMQRQLNEQTEKVMARARTDVFEKVQERRASEQRVQVSIQEMQAKSRQDDIAAAEAKMKQLPLAVQARSGNCKRSCQRRSLHNLHYVFSV